MVRELLTEAGFLATARAVGIPHLGASGPFEIMVPRAEAREAQEELQAILSQNAAQYPDIDTAGDDRDTP